MKVANLRFTPLPRRSKASKAVVLLGIAISMFSAGASQAEEPSLQDIAKAMQALPQIVIYQAREIVTLDPEKPTAEAVAVVGDRILAAGSVPVLNPCHGFTERVTLDRSARFEATTTFTSRLEVDCRRTGGLS